MPSSSRASCSRPQLGCGATDPSLSSGSARSTAAATLSTTDGSRLTREESRGETPHAAAAEDTHRSMACNCTHHNNRCRRRCRRAERGIEKRSRKSTRCDMATIPPFPSHSCAAPPLSHSSQSASLAPPIAGRTALTRLHTATDNCQLFKSAALPHMHTDTASRMYAEDVSLNQNPTIVHPTIVHPTIVHRTKHHCTTPPARHLAPPPAPHLRMLPRACSSRIKSSRALPRSRSFILLPDSETGGSSGAEAFAASATGHDPPPSTCRGIATC